MKDEESNGADKREQWIGSSLREHAIWALETRDPKVIGDLLNSAKKDGAWDVVSYIEERCPEISEELLASQLDDDLRNFLTIFPEYRVYNIDKSLLNRKGAKPIQLECQQHGIFGLSAKQLREYIQTGKTTQPCPLCRGFSKATDRLQINVRLDLEHSEKAAQLVGFYAKRSGFEFLEHSIKIDEGSFNSTTLGRVLLEKSIERVYLQMQNELRIDQLSGWIASETIGVNACNAVKEAWSHVQGDPLYHCREHTVEFDNFVESLQSRSGDIFDFSCLEWGTDIANVLFHKYWDKAFKVFLTSQAKKDESGRSKEIEMMLKMLDDMN